MATVSIDAQEPAARHGAAGRTRTKPALRAAVGVAMVAASLAAGPAEFKSQMRVEERIRQAGHMEKDDDTKTVLRCGVVIAAGMGLLFGGINIVTGVRELRRKDEGTGKLE